MSPQAVRFLIRDRRNKGWFRVSNDIWLMDISRYAKLVYCYLCRCAEDATTCNPSFPDIRRKTGCSHGTIVKALQELEKVGLIKRTPEAGTSTTYEIFDPIVERTQSQVDRPLPSHGLTAPQSQVDRTTQSQVDHKEDLVLNKTEVKKTLPPPAPEGGAAEQAQAVQGVLLEDAVVVEAEVVEGPTGSGRAAGGTPVTGATSGRPGHPAVGLFCESWKVKYDQNYDISGKDAPTLVRLSKKQGLEEYGHRLERYLRDDDPFLVKLAHPPSQFENRWNSLGLNGHSARPAGPALVLSRNGHESINEKWKDQPTGAVTL